MNLWLIFLTGLTTGGLSCLAMQGGLLASVIANQKDSENELPTTRSLRGRTDKFNQGLFDQKDWQPMLMFLSTKLVAHVIFGFALGWFGSMIALSLPVRLVFQIFTAFFMFATAMNLLDVHPVFRIVAFGPPKFLQKHIRKTSKSSKLFAPAILGVLTIFVPCGVTQAMEVLAVNLGNPLQGAMIMGAFVLGTSPLFAVLGLATAKLADSWYRRFAKIAAIVLLVMAMGAINGVLTVIDFPLTFGKIIRPISYFVSDERFTKHDLPIVTDGYQQVQINIENNGYRPNYFQVKSGIPVRLVLASYETYTCALAFVFKEFGINTFLDATDVKQFTFVPEKKGRFVYTCSMGMYSGVMEVI